MLVRGFRMEISFDLQLVVVVQLEVRLGRAVSGWESWNTGG